MASASVVHCVTSAVDGAVVQLEKKRRRRQWWAVVLRDPANWMDSLWFCYHDKKIVPDIWQCIPHADELIPLVKISDNDEMHVKASQSDVLKKIYTDLSQSHRTKVPVWNMHRGMRDLFRRRGVAYCQRSLRCSQPVNVTGRTVQTDQRGRAFSMPEWVAEMYETEMRLQLIMSGFLSENRGKEKT